MRSQKIKTTTKPLHRSALRRWHSLAGLISAVFLLGLSISGLYLNHQDTWFRSGTASFNVSDVETVLLSDGKRYMATPSALFVQTIPGDEVHLVFPMRHIMALQEDQGTYWVMTRSGLLLQSESLDRPRWKRQSLPTGSGEAYALSVVGNDLLVVTSEGIYQSSDLGESWIHVSKKDWSLRTFMRQLHSGWIAAPWLIYAHDLSAIILILLIVSGLLIYWRLFRTRLGKR